VCNTNWRRNEAALGALEATVCGNGNQKPSSRRCLLNLGWDAELFGLRGRYRRRLSHNDWIDIFRVQDKRKLQQLVSQVNALRSAADPAQATQAARRLAAHVPDPLCSSCRDGMDWMRRCVVG
jgi:hypothetical protein